MRKIKKLIVHYEDGSTDEWDVEGTLRVHNTELVKEDSATHKKTTLSCRWIGVEAVPK